MMEALDRAKDPCADPAIHLVTLEAGPVGWRSPWRGCRW
jgi:hypothetical protein